MVSDQGLVVKETRLRHRLFFRPVRSSLLNAALLVTVLGLLLNNLVLLHRIRNLNEHVAQLAVSRAPAVGSALPWLSGYDLSNHPLRIDCSRESHAILLLAFSRSCKYCAENWPYWHRLLRDLPGVRMVFADLQGDSDLAYFQQNTTPAPTVIKLDPEMKLAYNLMASPTTVVIGPKGSVLVSWSGVLDDDVVRQIEHAIQTAN